MRSARCSLAAALVPLIQGAASAPAPEGPLVVYSAHEPALSDPVVAKFRETFPAMPLEVVSLRPMRALERLRAERRRPAASVWWGADGLAFTLASREGLLAESSPGWAAETPEATVDPGKRWVAQFLNPVALAYRRGAVDLPARFEELADPRFRGRLALVSPPESTTMLAFLGSRISPLLRNPATAGRALDWVSLVHENVGDAYEVDPLRLLQRLGSPGAREGSPDLTVWIASKLACRRDVDGLSLEWTVLDDAPAILDGVARVANAPSPAAAGVFLEFVGRSEHRVDYVRAGAIPLVRAGNDASDLAPWMNEAQARARPIPLDLVADQLPSWLGLYEKYVRADAPREGTSEASGDLVMGVVDVIGTAAIVVVVFLLIRRDRKRTER